MGDEGGAKKSYVALTVTAAEYDGGGMQELKMGRPNGAPDK